MVTTLARPIPRTLDGALETDWLSEILAPISGGGQVKAATITDPLQVNQTVKSTIVKFRADFDNGTSADLVLKGYLDRPDVKGSTSALKESRFYSTLAERLAVRRPDAVATPFDDETSFGILYMRDMTVTAGAHFCSALEPFDANRTARSLEQLATLHGAGQIIGPVEKLDWTSRQIDFLAEYLKADFIQGLIDDQRREGIPEEVRDATRLLDGLRALAVVDAKRPTMLIHGDCHAGNVFETKDGAGLIDFELVQQGGWALDVAYHVAATLPADVAEKEERNLLRHYLETARGLGSDVPDDEEAWLQYRMSVVYGYFLWCITRTVKREIIDTFCHRLSHSVARHESYRLLGV